MPRTAQPHRRSKVRPARTSRPSLEAYRRELRFFIETAHTLTSSREPKTVIRMIINKARLLVRCRAWSLFLVDPATGDLVFEMVGAPKDRGLKGLRIRAGSGIAGWVAAHAKAAIVGDARTDRRFMREVDAPTGLVTRSVLCVPILSKGKPVAVLEMLNKIGAKFTRHDLQMLSRLINQASIALEHASLIEQVSNLAITDKLTGLYNARYQDQILEGEIRRCHRYRSTVAVIFLDVDRFKGINSLYGHPVGSQCLTEMADIIRRSVRDVDIAIRYGGDEFVAVLPEATVPIARMVAERLQQAIRAHTFLEHTGPPTQLTASIGIAGVPDHAKTKQELISKADEAMYRSKAAGGDRISIAEQA